MNTTASRTYIIQLPLACKTVFESIYQKEIREHSLNLVIADTCFIATTNVLTLYDSIINRFAEAITV